ncbi:MAG TPA: GNAT family N-acetyltransferase [Candidatus Sulfotelmatobacter sp.]|nr:GNAT family N-acetyltransferase [Candidatus Sulfotelmatobacter sp.]
MPVTLLASLDDDRFGADVLAQVHARAQRAGFTLRLEDGPDERLAAWIDAEFPGTWWSTEAAGSSTFIAERGEEILGFVAFAGEMDAHCRWLRAWRGRRELGMVGPVGISASERGSGAGALLITAALAELRARGYEQALFPAAEGERFVTAVTRLTDARIVDSFARGDFRHRYRATILASGAGTNARNVLQRVAAGGLPLDVDAVISAQPGAGSLDAAREHGVPPIVVAWDRAAESRAAYDARLADTVAATEPDVVLLLGWMHLLAPAFLARFPDTINVHPAFLPLDPRADALVAPDGSTIPALRGAHALRDALAQGVRWVGATSHRVTEHTDRGEVLVRIPVAVGETTSEPALRDKVRPAEFVAVESGIRRWAGQREGDAA